MGIIDGVLSHYRLFGVRGVACVAGARWHGRTDVVKVIADGYPEPIFLRLRTSDVSVFEEVIVHEEYEVAGYRRSPRWIVDAGANIGLTSVYFARRFPQAQIIAIEPERSNFEVLLRNVRPYPQITPVKAALWDKDEAIALSDPGAGQWGFRASADDTEPVVEMVPGLTLSTILQRHRVDHVDILKVDIEGAEKEVFRESAAWIARVSVILIELHERYKAGCEASVAAATVAFSCAARKGETTVLVRDVDLEHGDGSPAGPAQLRRHRPRIVERLT